MTEILTIGALVVGLAVVLSAAAKLGAGSADQGLLVYKPMPDRPLGTQEFDLPPLRFRDPVRGTHTASSGSLAARRPLEAQAA